MILTDTSVWIDYFNGNVSEETNYLDFALNEKTVVMGDLIFLEILQGFRKDEEYKQVRQLLATLEQFELFGRRMVDICANNYRSLRKKGITVRKTADLIIATFCIETNIPLLFADKDFDPFVDYLNMPRIQTNS